MAALAAHFPVAVAHIFVADNPAVVDRTVAVALALVAAAHFLAADNFALFRSVVDTVAVADKFVPVSHSPYAVRHTLCKICHYCAHRRYTSIPHEKLVEKQALLPDGARRTLRKTCLH